MSKVRMIDQPDDTDKLFQPWWDDVKAWSIEDNGKLIAAIETDVNLMRGFQSYATGMHLCLI